MVYPRASIKRLIKDTSEFRSRERKEYKIMLDTANNMIKQERREKESLQKEVSSLRKALPGCSQLAKVLQELECEIRLLHQEWAAERNAKADLIKYLDAEHAGTVSSNTPRPPRLARVHYDAIEGKVPRYAEAIVDIAKKARVSHQYISTEFHASLTVYAKSIISICLAI